MAKDRITPKQAEILRNLLQGGDAFDDCATNAEFGNRRARMRVLKRRGLVEPIDDTRTDSEFAYRITAFGRRALLEVDGVKPETTIYRGRRIPDDQRAGATDTVSPIVVEYQDDDEHAWRPLHPGPSQKIRDHSPDGFNWGYGGSGPAQLALAILFDFTGQRVFAELFYHDFKREFVSQWGDEWEISGAQINDFLVRVNNPTR